MKDDREYESIAGLRPVDLDFMVELRRSIAEIEALRGRPCLLYLANVIKKGAIDTDINQGDHISFDEMVCAADATAQGVDVVVVTPGGSMQQVQQFVYSLRARFPDSVEYLLPAQAYSAGTLWALSGDKIWMTEGANMGPIDPQVLTKEGRFVSAEAIKILVALIGSEGQQALKTSGSVPWHLVRVLDGIDKRDLADAVLKSQYAVDVATQFLSKYKFRHWKVDAKTGQNVDDAMRVAKAQAVASELASTERWKEHGHAITRDVAWSELRIEVDHPETVPGFRRVLRRLWALTHWIFDNTNAVKFMCSSNYSYIRLMQEEVRVVQQ